MLTVESTLKQLKTFLSELIVAKKIIKFSCLEIETSYEDDYLLKGEELVNKKLKFNYAINVNLHLEENNWTSKRVNTEKYDELYKCLLEVKLRVESELELHNSLMSMNEKIKNLTENLDEISFLKIELQNFLDKEEYEKAAEIEKKIKKLIKNKKKD